MDCGKIFKVTKIKLSKQDAIKIILILTITISLFSIQAPIFALTEGNTELFTLKQTGEQTSTQILPEIEGYHVKFIYRDLEFEKISGQDSSLMFAYYPESRLKPTVWVGIEISSTLNCLHRWESCLITWPQTHGYSVRVNELDLRDIHLIDNPPLSARYFAFQEKYSNSTQVVLYWFVRSVFKVGEIYQQKWIKISIVEYTNNPHKYETIEDELLPIAKTIAMYWQPIITWSWASLIIAKNGPTLIKIIVFILLGIFILYLYMEYDKRSRAKNAFTYISNSEDLYVLDAIKALTKNVATESKIASKYEDISGINIGMDKLHRILVEAEKSGLIQRKYININDEPYITWKPNF